MFKKILVAGLALTAGLFILRSTHLGSYVRTAFDKAKVSFKQSVPLEFQIEALRNELGNLDPEMKSHISKLAEETVKVAQLRDSIKESEQRVAKLDEKISNMSKDLVADIRPSTSSERRKITKEGELRAAVELGKRCKEEISTRKALLEAKERGLEVARQQLASMRTQQQTLETQIAQLETDLKTVRLKETESKFNLDDSKLAEIKARIDDIQGQIKVKQTEAMLSQEYGYSDKPAATKVESQTRDQLLKEVEAYLGNDKDGDVAKGDK